MSSISPKVAFPRESFPAIVHSSLWNSEEISALTKTDRQAVRIADYLHVYRDSETPQTKAGFSRKPDTATYRGQLTLSRGTARTNAHTGPSPPPSDYRRSLISPRNVTNSERKLETAKTTLNKLAQTVQKAVSDKLELKRDLATYEVLFCRGSKADGSIRELKQRAESFPVSDETQTEIIGWEKFAMEHISEGFQRVEKVETRPEVPSNLDLFEKSDFDLRLPSDISRYRQLYRGVCIISSLHSLVTVKSNGLFRQLLISSATLQGFVHHLTVRQDMMERENLMTKRQIHTAVKADILPHLYFQMESGGTHLMFDPACSVSFLSLMIVVKGREAPIHTSAELSEDQDSVHVSSLLGEVTIPRRELTNRQSIFQANQQQLATKLQQGLYYVDRTLVWQAEGRVNLLFHLKEANSLLFNEEYVNERLQTVTFTLLFSEKYQLDSFSYKIELLSHKDTLKFRIVGADRTVEIAHNSVQMAFLTSMQGLDCRLAKATLLRSLELKTVVKQAFSLKS